MKTCLLLILAIWLALSLKAQEKEAGSVRTYEIPIEGSSYIPIHRFSTQGDVLIGTAVLVKGDRPATSYYADIKGYYFPTGAIYLCTGAGLGFLNSVARNGIDGAAPVARSALAIELPSGIGFTLGDDRANFFSGVNFVPVYYARIPEGIAGARHLTWGIAPEFGFRMKAGRRDVKGVQLGIVGQLHLMKPPSRYDGNLKHCTYAGVGLVVRFY